MRILSLLALVVVLLIVGLLAKKQLAPVPVVLPGAEPSASAPAHVRDQSQQIQQQFKQSLDAAMQQRPMPDDKAP